MTAYIGVTWKLYIDALQNSYILIYIYNEREFMEKIRKSPKRIIFNLTDDQHKDIKIRAAFMNISITKWVKMAISERIKEEKKYE